MSRIAGLLTPRESAWSHSEVDRMLAAMEAEAWGRELETAGEATLGWTGAGESGLIRAGDLLVAFDGFIYNRGELGAEDPDALLIARLYREHGIDGAVQRLGGDFALALYDPAERTLFLARDRIGVKPMYYFAGGSDLTAFASRPGPLTRLPGASSAPDRTYVALIAASHYRTFDNRPESSPYADVAQVPAAHVVRIHDGSVSAKPYWSLDGVAEVEGSEDELAEHYRELLLDAVSTRLAAAGRPAFTLSGGMDSSSVIASASRIAGRHQHAFSATYSDRTFDETDDIRPMLDAAVEEWHPIAIGTPDVIGLVERMVAVHDEPVATATWLSHYLICDQVAADGFSSLFGGLGGDELNAGEYEHFFFHFADLRAAGREPELEHEIALWAQHHDHPIYRKSPAVVEDAFNRLVDLSRPGHCLPDRARLERYAGVLNPEFFDLHGFEPVMEEPFDSYLRNRAYQDLTRETTPCCLRAEDRQTAAFGIDHFDPFLDHRLVEFMFAVPGSMKIRDGVTKRLLREATVGILPDETRLRVAKTGWNAPAHVWFSGEDREPLLDLVRSQSFRERGIYNVGEVERLIDEHNEIVAGTKPRENHMMFLWQLVNLELWLEGLDRAEAPTAP